MKREDLEHIIRASGVITDEYEFVIVGSQSLLGGHPYPPEVFTALAEADIYPLHAPEKADDIDGAIGEGSQFHESNGYYAQGVGPDTAILPDGWLRRVDKIQNDGTNSRIGYCLSAIDLFMAKVVANRDRDRDQRGAVGARLRGGRNGRFEVDQMLIDTAAKGRLRARVKRWVGIAQAQALAKDWGKPDKATAPAFRAVVGANGRHISCF
ncbi:DUF6036 family nucleotidyltransferase [Cupriavidus sp. SIMBA_020]|uniref:DUF6036 family nucleotidyltransferase n=1 Tax=Cupriavidus sp. SIMBA_020 TaxID=3085766 RepID=UPI00397DD32F